MGGLVVVRATSRRGNHPGEWGERMHGVKRVVLVVSSVCAFWRPFALAVFFFSEEVGPSKSR